MTAITNTSEPIQPYKVYRADEAAEVLQIDRSTLYSAVEAGTIEYKKLGKGYKFLGEHLLRFMGSATYTGDSTGQQPVHSTAGTATQT